MTMYKRVIYRQKHSLFVISSGVPRPDMSRVRSAPPPDIEPFTQQFVDLKISAPVEKGLVLKNKDGLVITEEMLANLSDSSSEDEEIQKTEVLKKKEEEKHSVVEKQEKIEDKKINEETKQIKEEEKQTLEIKEMIKEEIKKEVKEAIKETVKEEVKEKLKESPLYTFKVPKDLKELIDKEPSKQDHFQESTNNAMPREMPKFSLFSGKDSSEKKEGTPYIYQMPTLITPKTVYKKPDQGTSRKKLLVNRIKRVYKVDELLHFKERNSVPLIYDRSLFMKAEMSEAEKLESKVYDTVSLYRRELNRLAKSTYEKVIREIKKLTINTNEEMTQIAEITFEKAVKETSFQDLYIGLIRALKNSFFSIEEGGEKQKSHSVFWSIICHKCKDVFTNKESWVNELALKENSFRSFEERCKFEDEFEEKEGERIKKKGRIFGTIKLFANFFNSGMISDNFILIIITQLKTNITDQENVEMLCHLFENCGEKLMKKNEKIFNEIIEAMKANINIYEQKVRFVILNLIELKIPAWKVAPKKSLFGTNTFAGLKIVKDITQPNEEKKPEIDYNSLFKNIRLVLSEEGSDISALRQNVIKNIKDRNKAEFMNEFFFNISENYEIVDETVLFFLSLANLFKKEEIITSLKETFDLLDDLKYDAPFCYGNFYKLVLYLQSEAIINEEDISSLKISTFENEKNKILKQWLSNFDNNLRIERVSSDDKVIILLNECVKESGEDRFICYLKKYNLIQ